MLRTREAILILLAAILIAVLAWAILASDESSAPEEEPGTAHERPAPSLYAPAAAGGLGLVLS